MEVTLVERPDGRTAATVLSRFPSREAFDQLLAMGMLDGLWEAMGQIDPILAEG